MIRLSSTGRSNVGSVLTRLKKHETDGLAKKIKPSVPQGLQVLKDSGVRFLVGQIEHDLFDPNAELFLGMATQINQYVAKITAQKSMRNRIALASRCIPAVGKLPYGRTFDWETETWGIDKEKQKKIAWAAGEYLKGEQFPKLAQKLGMDAANLWKIVTRRSRDTWEVKFLSKRIGIDEKVTLKIQPLLSPETIRKIHDRAEANKTCTHGMKKYQYLARAVFCSKCGYVMFGQTNHSGSRYYRHPREEARQRKCDPSLWVRANELEEAVLVLLFATLGDASGMERAMLKAIPDRAKIEELRERKRFLESELSKVEARKGRLIESIAEGIISKDEAATKMTEIRGRETSLKSEIDGIDPQLAEMPTEEEIRRKAKFIQRIAGDIYRSPARLAKMSFEDRRKLVSTFFSGKDSQGKRLGVYVEKTSDGRINYEIRGTFDQTFKGTLTPDGPDILDLPDSSVERLEELKEAVRGKGGISKQNSLSRDLR